MKKLFPLLLFLIASATIAQQVEHTCSQKSKYFLLNTQNNKAASIQDEYDIHFYKLDLHLERNSVFVEGNVQILAKTTAPMDTFVCQLHDNHTVDSVYLNGQSTSFTHTSDLIHVPTGNLNSGSKLDIIVYYSGTAPSSGSSAIGQGLSTGSSPSWSNEVTWSLSEPYSAYEWFPVKQELQDKADSVEVWITTDRANKAGSQGVLQNITLLPNNKHRFEWKSNYPIAYYLISVAVAKYVDYTIYAHPTGTNDSIPIVNYIYDNPGTLPNFQTEINKTADMLEVFSEKFGLYPFHEEKYGHCMAPFSGGMEHQTMTSQGFFTTDLTSHELGHQWFGDDVTCGSWVDIFLNEGFASYLEYVYIQEKEPTRADAWLNSTYSRAAQLTGSVMVDDTSNVGRIFSSSLSYNKGAYFLHMLRWEVNNDSLYFNALKTYRQSFSGKTALSADLKNVVEQVTNIDFTYFWDQWYSGEGFPFLTGTYALNNDTLYLKIEQAPTAPTITPLFKMHLPINFILFDKAKDTTIRVWMDEPSQLFKIHVPSDEVGIFDLNYELWNLVAFNDPTPDPTLGVKENEHNGIRFYPNPVEDVLNVDLSGLYKELNYRLLNLKGSEVMRGRLSTATRLTLDLSSLPSGVYVLDLQGSGGLAEQMKVVKE